MKNFALFTITFFCLLGCSSEHVANKKPNILFIAVDDLRPELGCYGSDIAQSPHIDALASNGLLFTQAYCQQAICGPSRASLMTGIRPEESGVIHNYIPFRDKMPNQKTIAQFFGENGYHTVRYGKIFHHGDEDSISWNYPALEHLNGKQEPKGYVLTENKARQKQQRQKMFAKYGKVARYGLTSGPAYECADVPDNAYRDGFNTDLAIATLKKMVKQGDKPFFLALGFHKPHLNWNAPKKYWDMYKPQQIPMASDSLPPINAAAMGLHPSFELRTRQGIPKTGAISAQQARKLKHAYLACVSYVDAQVGRMLEALEETGVKDNTIIVLWGDHGWHLGDMGIWGKATNYEIATRVPFILSAPNMPTENRGKKTEALAELVDIYPTLCDLAGLSIPKQVQGCSLKPLFDKPNRAWKKAAFSQFPTPALREWGAFPLRPAMRETFFGPLIREVENRIKQQQQEKWQREFFERYLVGYAMRTKRYRFIVWRDRRKPLADPLAVELYDHQTDPAETINIAENKPALVNRLMVQFNKGWRGNGPN